MRPQAVRDHSFDRLSSVHGEDLISIFIPTHIRGREVRQDPIRLKNELQSADETLQGLGWSLHDRQARLSGAWDLLEDREFWEHQEPGLAVYIGERGLEAVFGMSTSPGAATLVLPVFQMRPLLPDLEPITATVLALTRGWVALFSARDSAFEEMDADLPSSFQDVNWFVDREQQRQHHPARTGAGGNRHGHEPSLRAEEDLNRFLRAVSDAVEKESPAGPLVVLGDDDVVTRFESVHHTPIVRRDKGGLSGVETTAEVEERFSAISQQLAIEREAAWIDEARSAIGTGQAVSLIDEALPAAAAGRVRSVVLHHETVPVWGRVGAGSTEVISHEERTVGDVDLIDRLVVEARSTGADLHAVGADIEGRPFAALLRY